MDGCAAPTTHARAHESSETARANRYRNSFRQLSLPLTTMAFKLKGQSSNVAAAVPRRELCQIGEVPAVSCTEPLLGVDPLLGAPRAAADAGCAS